MTQQTSQTEQPSRRRREFRSVTVKAVEHLTPRLVRVTFADPSLATMVTRGPAEHLKVLFAPPGQDRPTVPSFDEEGRPVYPPGVERPVSRTYTPRRLRTEAGELDIDFVLHGEEDGPGSAWARGAKPGDGVVVTPPGGAFQLDPAARWYLIAGDDAAVPAVATILEALPAGVQADVYLEVADAEEELPLSSAADLSVTWLHRDSDGVAPGSLLEDAVSAAALSEGKGRVFVACEASVMRAVRKRLLVERGLDRADIYTHGYWKQDEPNHPDHDLGQEI